MKPGDKEREREGGFRAVKTLNEVDIAAQFPTEFSDWSLNRDLHI